jgi:predicted nucleotidyltransferase
VSEPLTSVDEAVLGPILRGLVEVFRPEQIYLFGSRARGDWREDSDYDLMVIVSDSDDPPHRRAQLAYRELWRAAAGKDILVWTRDEFEHFLPVVASLAATIKREGRLLYAA